ncbi:translation elongation factor 4 [Candidatus Legionella polyplacis]|uniref:Elongation factor 4 n=1 Tax=Candidatus Legionella polyplacis TaxID=2005262 RepID=A0ABZ2H060_9GAMM
MKNIRNFSIIAHVDHGKSTLADRFIQNCGTLSDREMMDQVLDSMDIERERGITIKAQSVSLNYISCSGISYLFNIIDTPGHIDFFYEVSRALSACEGAILLIDATQGIEAQTIGVCREAINKSIKILPVLNKIDLINKIDLNLILNQFQDLIGIKVNSILQISAKFGLGISNLFESIIDNIPSPKGDINSPLQALIIDSWFNNYFGVVFLVRVVHGFIKKGDSLKIMSNGKICIAEDIGIFTPKRIKKTFLKSGEVGYVVSGIKNINNNLFLVGDTLTKNNAPACKSLLKFKCSNPKIYSSLFLLDNNDIAFFKKSLLKLKLNDASLFFEDEFSEILGYGFRCGFSGKLHMEIIQERLKREYNLNIISTIPTVSYQVLTKDGQLLLIDRPSKILNYNHVKQILEPIVRANIVIPYNCLGKIINLCTQYCGVQVSIIYNSFQVFLVYDFPMSNIILNFFDLLKSKSNGYASLYFNFLKFQPSNVVKMDILINKKIIDIFSVFIRKDMAYHYGKNIVEKLCNIIPRQMFDIVVQSAVNNRIIVKRIIKAFRKNVIDKCYGGDISRKNKLLNKQKYGKKQMKKIGNVNISKSIFIEIFKFKKNNIYI